MGEQSKVGKRVKITKAKNCTHLCIIGAEGEITEATFDLYRIRLDEGHRLKEIVTTENCFVYLNYATGGCVNVKGSENKEFYLKNVCDESVKFYVYEINNMNNEIKHKQILDKAIDKYGALEQCLMAQEEAAELIQAINKLRRLGGIAKNGIYQPHGAGFYGSTKYALAYNNLCSEVADLEIMITQLRKMLRPEQIDLIKERKISRLENRLNEKEDVG